MALNDVDDRLASTIRSIPVTVLDSIDPALVHLRRHRSDALSWQIAISNRLLESVPCTAGSVASECTPGENFCQHWRRVFFSDGQAITALRKKPPGYDECMSGSDFYAYVNNDPLNLMDPTGTETQVGLAGGGTIAWLLGINASVNPGISIPDNPLNIGGYQLFLSVQATGYAGLGGYAGAGLSVTGAVSSGPLAIASAGPTWQAEADAGYGPSIGLSVGGNRTDCSGSGGSCTWQAPSSGSFTPNPQIGAGFGIYAGAGPGANVTLATPTVGQIGDALTSGYNAVTSWLSASQPGK